MGNGLKVASFFYGNGSKVTLLLYKVTGPPLLRRQSFIDAHYKAVTCRICNFSPALDPTSIISMCDLVIFYQNYVKTEIE
jgi:hypothetical protein